MAGVVGLFVVSFEQLALLELRAGADEGDEVGCVHGTPPGLGGLDELPDTTADERRVLALVILTNPGATPDDVDVDLSEIDLKPLRPKVQLYLHGHTSSEVDADGEPTEGIVRVEGHGPVTWHWLRTMLGDK